MRLSLDEAAQIVAKLDLKAMLNAIHADKVSIVGVRCLREDEHYRLGDWCRCSYDWDLETDQSTYGSANPVELDGCCCVSTGRFVDLDVEDKEELEEAKKILAEAIKEASTYGGDTLAVIAGYGPYTYGADENEIVVKNAEVILLI